MRAKEVGERRRMGWMLVQTALLVVRRDSVVVRAVTVVSWSPVSLGNRAEPPRKRLRLPQCRGGEDVSWRWRKKRR